MIKFDKMNRGEIIAELIRGTYGCPCGNHVEPWFYNVNLGEYLSVGNCYDRYHAVPIGGDWHEIVRGDGRCYNGIVEILENQDETFPEFVERARRAAKEWTLCDR